MTKKKTVPEIVTDTEEFYGSDPSRRAISYFGGTALVSGCRYFIPQTGQKCAVGRCLSEDGLAWVTDHKLLGSAVSELDKFLEDDDLTLDSLLRAEYRGLPLDFWAELQQIHDNDSFYPDVVRDKKFGFTPEHSAQLRKDHAQYIIYMYGKEG
jgi:hypothetical protein